MRVIMKENPSKTQVKNKELRNNFFVSSLHQAKPDKFYPYIL